MNRPTTSFVASSRFPRRQFWRWLIPVLLVLFFLSILLWLPRQVQQIASNEYQEQLIADTLWVEQTIRFQLGRLNEDTDKIRESIVSGRMTTNQFAERAELLVRINKEVERLVWLDEEGRTVASTDEQSVSLETLPQQTRDASERARKTGKPQYSRPTATSGLSAPALDYHLPMERNDRYIGSLITSYRPVGILEHMVPWWFARDHEIVLADGNDNVIARRISGGPGRSVYTHSRSLELPGGVTLSLRTNSVKNSPQMLPSLLVGSVIALSFGLLWSLWALWNDINRRLAAEDALRQQVAFRTAMENSLITGLRARDLEGRITYVNPAFCEMVGIPAEKMLGTVPPMAYWAPEAMEVYQERFSQVLAGTVTPQFETVFQRASGERFPVLIFESPLVDDSGRQTGWMGSILDISDRRRAEDLNRIHEEKLQGSARLASMGELASTLAHELNQPLAAISSYTTGAINLLQSGTVEPALLRPALEKANLQAQRAGQIIRSVHEFIRKREPSREPVNIPSLVESVIPLVELQARQFFVAIQTSFRPALPPVLADRVMLEQVLLNLTRNAIEAMQHIAPERRILRIVVQRDPQPGRQQQVEVQVIDHGHGIPSDVAERLFSPFFSTKAEGMGMGLNICRTTIEFHGGTLTHAANPAGGTIFRFSVPSIGNEERGGYPAPTSSIVSAASTTIIDTNACIAPIFPAPVAARILSK